jgi:hypothetical protein
MVRIRVKKAKQLAFLARNNLFKHCLNNRHNNRDLGMLDDALLKSNFVHLFIKSSSIFYLCLTF